MKYRLEYRSNHWIPNVWQKLFLYPNGEWNFSQDNKYYSLKEARLGSRQFKSLFRCNISSTIRIIPLIKII